MSKRKSKHLSTYRHKQTKWIGTVAWETEQEVGVATNEGLTWTGSRQAFEKEWEPTS